MTSSQIEDVPQESIRLKDLIENVRDGQKRIRGELEKIHCIKKESKERIDEIYHEIDKFRHSGILGGSKNKRRVETGTINLRELIDSLKSFKKSPVKDGGVTNRLSKCAVTGNFYFNNQVFESALVDCSSLEEFSEMAPNCEWTKIQYKACSPSETIKLTNCVSAIVNFDFGENLIGLNFRLKTEIKFDTPTKSIRLYHLDMFRQFSIYPYHFDGIGNDTHRLEEIYISPMFPSYLDIGNRYIPDGCRFNNLNKIEAPNTVFKIRHNITAPSLTLNCLRVLLFVKGLYRSGTENPNIQVTMKEIKCPISCYGVTFEPLETCCTINVKNGPVCFNDYNVRVKILVGDILTNPVMWYEYPSINLETMFKGFDVTLRRKLPTEIITIIKRYMIYVNPDDLKKSRKIRPYKIPPPTDEDDFLSIIKLFSMIIRMRNDGNEKNTTKLLRRAQTSLTSFIFKTPNPKPTPGYEKLYAGLNSIPIFKWSPCLKLLEEGLKEDTESINTVIYKFLKNLPREMKHMDLFQQFLLVNMYWYNQ